MSDISKDKTYLKGYAKGRGWVNLPKAIAIAEILHEDQHRKATGEPYLNHPLRVAASLLACGIDDDIILSIAILHDTIEDCDLKWCFSLFDEYHINSSIIDGVRLLTKSGDKSKLSESDYYSQISRDPRTLLVKVADRCHNVSTMGGAFSATKMESYIKETEEFVMPLIQYGKKHYPEYADALFVMKYHIESLMDTIRACLAIGK